MAKDRPPRDQFRPVSLPEARLVLAVLEIQADALARLAGGIAAAAADLEASSRATADEIRKIANRFPEEGGS